VILGFESRGTHDRILLSDGSGSLPDSVQPFEVESVTLRPAVYRQSVRLGANPPETHDQLFVFQLNPCAVLAFM
jgi:hypothetical protein